MTVTKSSNIQNYAGILVDNTSTATTITLANSYFLISVFDTNMPEQISTGDQANNRITVGATGDYILNFHGHGESAAANKVFEWYVFELEGTTNIEDATQADPVVITATGHGLSNGDKVAIKDLQYRMYQERHLSLQMMGELRQPTT
jgi:hypothetical protein